MQFCKEFNARTQQAGDVVIPVVITAYVDRSFTFITKTPPAAVLLKKAAKIKSGSGEPNKKKVGKVTKAQIQEIAETKMPDLNAASLEAAMNTIAGTARSMKELQALCLNVELLEDPTSPRRSSEAPAVPAGLAQLAREVAEKVGGSSS